MEELLRSFKWEDIGDIAKGRPTLGIKTHVAVYRLFQYTLRNVLEKSYGKEAVNRIFVDAGRQAGTEFCKNLLDMGLPPESFFAQLHQKLKELEIGVLNIELADYENMIFILTVSEDLDCSGLPITGETVCCFDEGFIIGILQAYTGKQFEVRETDCWSTGAYTCRFNIVAIEDTW